MQAVWGSNLRSTHDSACCYGKTTPGKIPSRRNPRVWGEGPAPGLFSGPSGSGQEVGCGRRVGPTWPRLRKDTRLDVGSHDVTGDVEVDADELALSMGKRRSRRAPQPRPLHPTLRAGSIQATNTEKTEVLATSPSLTGQHVRRTPICCAGTIRGHPATRELAKHVHESVSPSSCKDPQSITPTAILKVGKLRLRELV